MRQKLIQPDPRDARSRRSAVSCRDLRAFTSLESYMRAVEWDRSSKYFSAKGRAYPAPRPLRVLAGRSAAAMITEDLHEAHAAAEG